MRKPIVSKTPVWKVMALGAGIGLAMLSYPVHAAPVSGGDTVQGLYEALLSTMKNGRTLGQSGRFTQLEPVIRRTFDIPSMARLSVGPSWVTLTDAQRQQVTESFGRYISAIYADRFDSYDGQKLQVIGEQPAVAGIMVRSQIVKANGEPVNVDYMMRRDGDSWLISDIYLDGAISEVATRRSEFAAILKSQGIDGLIAALNRKADILHRRSLGTRVAAGRSPLLRWSYLDRRHLKLVFGHRLGRDCDRTLASYLGSCRHARSSLRATIVSTVTGAAVGRTFSLATRDRIGVDTSRGRRIAIGSSRARKTRPMPATGTHR